MKTTFTHLDLSQLDQISENNVPRKLKYLRQFEELIPERVQSLQTHLANQDRMAIKQVVHNMGPQLIFFGIPDFPDLMQQIENNFENLPMEELTHLTEQIIEKTDIALEEISICIQEINNQNAT